MLNFLVILFTILNFIIVLTSNPFMCLIYLVLSFITSCFITLFLGLEYLGLVILLVYVGALAILFLFVIMLLDIRAVVFRNLKNKFNLGIIFPFILLILVGIYNTDVNQINYDLMSYNVLFDKNFNLVETLGKLLYIQFPEILILSSLVLTVSLIGALVLVI